MTMPIIQCAWCKHYYRDRTKPGTHCSAFPDTPIPNDIIQGRHDHREAYPGDHGVRWEPTVEGEAHPFDRFAKKKEADNE